MVEWLQVSLRAWDPSARPIPRAEFLDRLVLGPDGPVSVPTPPDNPRVRLLAISRDDFAHVDTSADAGARSEAFVAAVTDGLTRAAAWLTLQPVDVFESLRAGGRRTEVFVGAWVTQDQFDLDVPPAFLRACGVLGLTLSICTND